VNIFVTGLSYKSAPVEVREKLAVRPSLLPCLGCRLKINAGLEEAVLLSTCNRVEVYGVAPWAQSRMHRISRQLCPGDVDMTPHLYLKEGAAAVRHLFAVASGLDSMVLGETEITGQVKLAYQSAQTAKLTGKILNRVFQTAFQVAKEIRTRTGIGRGATSVGSVAVELAEKIFAGDLSDKTVMILGAGKMGEACVRHLAKSGARSVLVANRSLERARTLAAEFGGRALPFEERLSAIAAADIVVSSTGSPTTVLHKDEIAGALKARASRPLVLVDIAVPRDIAFDVEELDNVYLYNIDHLEAIVRENSLIREQELFRCNEIIARSVASLMLKLNPPPVVRPVASVELSPGLTLSEAAI
jgi:glutamyl-tRNA reductase